MMNYRVKGDFLIFKDGEVISEESISKDYLDHIPMYLEKGLIEVVDEVKKEPDFDFNKDGVVDKKDVKLGAQIMAKKKGRPKKVSRR